ncbi:hypothetical protein BWQ96_04243 [Gracilariopsis chorda]|uniref:Uncharacterized protein n=1 Tax=Gracilariopsis chorda TaxID=448386 RepID=A0A2V3IW93_9FLOR|nr:hypothetical protein BWQ96_04243 [Gracilariopsis chorda]|eukprot:PXF45987.1 hypothetical protein BWQ96_04243 [Gracilariopsis chorda]
MTRSGFTALNAKRVDLSKKTGKKSGVPCTKILQQASEAVFSWNDFENLIKGAATPTNAVPSSHVLGSKKQYSNILLQAHKAGMLAWSVVSKENNAYREIANHITMYSFAVVKDEARDRLIRWSKFQNQLLPDPPHTFVPCPELFSKYSIGCGKLSSFYLDIENMVYSIPLPPEMANIFPLQAIRASVLPKELLSFDAYHRQISAPPPPENDAHGV